MMQSDRPQMIAQNMRIVCWMPKATHTQNVQYLLLFCDINSYMNMPDLFC